MGSSESPCGDLQRSTPEPQWPEGLHSGRVTEQTRSLMKSRRRHQAVIDARGHIKLLENVVKISSPLSLTCLMDLENTIACFYLNVQFHVICLFLMHFSQNPYITNTKKLILVFLLPWTSHWCQNENYSPWDIERIVKYIFTNLEFGVYLKLMNFCLQL